MCFMKNRISFSLIASMAFLILALISCDKPVTEPSGPDVPTPEEPQPEKPELKENTYIVSDEVFSFGSVAVSNLGDYICIAASVAQGVQEFDAVFEQEQYFYVAISPLLNGREFDLKTEKQIYTVMSTIDGASLETVAPSMTEEIQEGKCTFNYAEGVAAVQISLVTADGQEFSALLSAEEPGIVVNENVFAIGGDEKPVRTAFVLREDDTTALYLTPAGIDFFEDLEITTYYAYIILEDEQCLGRTLTSKDLIAVGYADNFNELIVDSADVPTSGTVNVSADPDDPAHYIVSADLDFAGTSLKIRFDGNALDANAKESVANEVIYEGKSYPIKEVFLDTMPSVDAICTVLLILEDGRSVNITLPMDFLDGNAHGFSQSPSLYMEFDGKTFSKAEGCSGTVTVKVEGDHIKVEATDYDSLKVIYEGQYTEVS